MVVRVSQTQVRQTQVWFFSYCCSAPTRDEDGDDGFVCTHCGELCAVYEVEE
jgi:hypothetical protein